MKSKICSQKIFDSDKTQKILNFLQSIFANYDNIAINKKIIISDQGVFYFLILIFSDS